MLEDAGMAHAALCHRQRRNTLDNIRNKPDTAGDTTKTLSIAHNTSSGTKGQMSIYNANTTKYRNGTTFTSRVALRSIATILLTAALWSWLSIG